ncbi:PAS domain S-box protein [Ancylothrix sp. C2]|uniref:adenylate/guanylate cyclase domain-containing protein n=1 Tax=Ancylothrix sp. D3o TaxID=2953691 RepID=UPI0021BADDC6|nr:adenylate/guanylate cyclase domain-containing protein [Ancylothrix sp. D3o]MCT7948511.1 PAS domain S-box protein [Ancylothrix sp. D3o]
MKKVLQKLFVPDHLEYLTLDENLMIVELSSDVKRFADCPDEVGVGNDVRVGFPELIGTEELLEGVFCGEEKSFELKSIGRFPNDRAPLYLDFYVNLYQDEESQEKKLIVFFEDVTDRMMLEQRLVQSSNETHLLLAALSNSRNYINQIISSMAEALVVTKNSGQIKSVNPAAENLFGYEQEELQGENISILIADRNFLNLIAEEAILGDGELLKDIELVCHTKAGQKIIVEFSCSRIAPDSDSNANTEAGLKDIIYIGRNITERQRTQQRLTAQYAIGRILSEATNFEQALPKILLAICEVLGWTLGEFWIVEETSPNRGGEFNLHRDFLPPSKILKCAEIWSRPSAVSGEFIEFSKSLVFAWDAYLPGHVWATRSSLWVSDVLQEPLFRRKKVAEENNLHTVFSIPVLSNGEVLGVMVFFHREIQQPDQDLLQTMNAIASQIGQFMKRKRAEIALVESEERYRDLFENATDLIQSVGPDGSFIYVNRAWKETLGYSEADLANMSVFEVLDPDCKEQCLEMFQRVISGEQCQRVQAAFRSKTGQRIFVEGSVNCKFVEGKPVATRGIFRDITQRLLAEEALRHEQEQTERLLLNILPEAIADRLKQEHATIAESFAAVTVLFADIVGFTEIASSLSPIALVSLLNQIFSSFDRLTEHYGLEKIKTIGDAYMVVGGLPKRRVNHAEAIAEMALDMQGAIAEFNAQNNLNFNIRIGIHSGPVVAGVIGIKKFIYDLWGDTVNTASRMESHGSPGRIHISDTTHRLLRHKYVFEKRGIIQVKGKGEMRTYFLLARQDIRDLQSIELAKINFKESMVQASQRLIKRIKNKLEQDYFGESR